MRTLPAKGKIEHAPFLAAGWSLEVAQRFIAEGDALHKAAIAFVREVGGDTTKLVYSDRAHGFTVEVDRSVSGFDGWKATKVPRDAIRLKLSEYHAMKERNVELRKAEKTAKAAITPPSTPAAP